MDPIQVNRAEADEHSLAARLGIPCVYLISAREFGNDGLDDTRPLVVYANRDHANEAAEQIAKSLRSDPIQHFDPLELDVIEIPFGTAPVFQRAIEYRAEVSRLGPTDPWENDDLFCPVAIPTDPVRLIPTRVDPDTVIVSGLDRHAVLAAAQVLSELPPGGRAELLARKATE